MSEREHSAESDAPLTEREKALRDWLREQPGGDEKWFIIKAGFRRSYLHGQVDAMEEYAQVCADRESFMDLRSKPSAMDGREKNVWNLAKFELRERAAKVRLRIRPTRDTPPAEKVERCPECRHMPHGSLGFCPNMASDNECSCTYVTPPAKSDGAS